jgi:hypothetical protein
MAPPLPASGQRREQGVCRSQTRHAPLQKLEIAMVAVTEETKSEKTKPEKTRVLVVPLAQRLALTLAECCALTGLKMYQLRFAIRDGELSFIQNGKRGQYIVRREELDKFLRTHEQREAR